MLKKTVFLLSLVAILCSLSSCCPARSRITDNSHPITESHGRWRLGTQAYTFRKFTFFEAVEKAESLGLNWIEAYPGQKLSKETGDVRFNHETSAENRDMVKKRLAESRVRLVNYGVVRLDNDEAQCRQVFDFARDMGIEIKTVRAGSANMFLSPIFASAFATVTDAHVELYNTDGSQGAARGAGLGAGVYKDFVEAFTGLKKTRTIEPDASLKDQYAEAYSKWHKVLEAQLG